MNRYSAITLSLSVSCLLACNLIDDEPSSSDDGGNGETGDPGPTDNEVCLAALDALPDLECAPGFSPQLFFDGGASNIVLVDDPAIQVGANVGLLVNFGVGAGADWLATDATQNTACTFGCFAGCAPGGSQDGCFSNPASGGSCMYCADEIEEGACTDFVLACQGIDPDPGDGGGDPDGGVDETGGADESSGGGADTTSGAMAYGCEDWDPSSIYQPTAGGPFRIPQALVDQLVLGTADALADCDGVLFREANDGHWAISSMSGTGMLGALGLQVGDRLLSFNGVQLDSLDAIASTLVTDFLTKDGSPRQFSAADPGFSLRVRRGQKRFVVGLDIEPAGSGSGGGADEGGADTTGGW